MSANQDSKLNQDSQKHPEPFSNELDQLEQKNSEYQDHLKSMQIIVPSAHEATWSESCFIPGFHSGPLSSTLLPLEISLDDLAWSLELDTSVVKQDPPAMEKLASKIEQSIAEMESYCKEFSLRQSNPIPESLEITYEQEVFNKFLTLRSAKVQDTILKYLLPTCSQLISTVKLGSNESMNGSQIQAKDSTKSPNFSQIHVITTQLIQSIDEIKYFVGQKNFQLVQFLWQESANTMTILCTTAEGVYLPDDYLYEFVEMAAVVFKLTRIFLKKLLKSATEKGGFKVAFSEPSTSQVKELMKESVELYVKLQENKYLISVEEDEDEDDVQESWVWYFSALESRLESIYSLVNSQLLATSTAQKTKHSSSDTAKKTCLDTWYPAWKVQFTITHQRLMELFAMYQYSDEYEAYWQR